MNEDNVNISLKRFKELEAKETRLESTKDFDKIERQYNTYKKTLEEDKVKVNIHIPGYYGGDRNDIEYQVEDVLLQEIVDKRVKDEIQKIKVKEEKEVRENTLKIIKNLSIFELLKWRKQ